MARLLLGAWVLGFLLLGFSLLGKAAPPEESADERLRALYEREFAWRQAQEGYVRGEGDDWERAAAWPDVSADAQGERLAYWEEALAELERIPRSALSDAERINAAVFEQIVSTLVSNARYRTYEAPLNSDSFFWDGLYPRAGGFDDADDYRRYIARLRDLPRYFAQHEANMRAALGRGYTVPRVTLEGREESIIPFLAAGRANPLWTPLADMPARIDGETRARLEADALDAIDGAAVPAYRALLDFMRKVYLPGARETLAARELPEGEAFYRAQIRRFTTLDLSPEEIHETGLAEVARIREQMLVVKEEAGFDGSLPEFIVFLRTDPRFVAATPEELLGVSSYVAKRMDGHLDDVLGFLPRRRFTIRPVPDAIAPFYTGGRGGLDACLMNTYDLPSRPLYNIPALTLHECAPGHALQAAIALEAPGDIPEFRARNYFSGYGEGWGLYTEWLGGQLGIYRTPYEKFGQLSYEMWRACRLVIDTGVHYFGWSRDEALAYLRDHTALSEHEVTTEIDRYISWPAQALAYKLGELLIREKRAEAETTLGADFDQRYFHDVILGLRSVPLPVLANELDAWIAAGGPDPYADSDLDS